MFREDNRGRYSVLEIEDGSEGSRESEDTSPPNQTPIRWLIITCLISLVISTLNFSVTSLWEAPPPPQKPTVNARFPSVYIGLERLNISQRILDLPPVLNYPLLISSLSEAKPGEVDHNGSVVQVDSSHTTVMQFRVHDFGLERCTINVTIPEPQEMGRKVLTLSGNTRLVQVWRLEDLELRPRTLAWSNKPARKALLGTLDFTPGTSSYLPWFSCRSNTLQTFEFVCPSGVECGLRWKQDHAAPLLGIMMYQIHT